VVFLPDGIWPPLSRALGLQKKTAEGDKGSR
jgi:hypothetical protein